MFESIKALILRNTPKIAESFLFETIDPNNGNDCYVIEKYDDKIMLKGNNCVTLALAYHNYLRTYHNFDIHRAAEKDRINTAVLPLKKHTRTILQKKRVVFDYGTYSYDAWKWDFERWERELDHLTMNGINMALNLVGNEAVLFNTMVKMDFTERIALEFINGPAFFAWQATKKFDGYLPHRSFEWLEKSFETAKKVYDRMIELDITPILSTFSGLIPEVTKKLFTTPKYKIIEPWFAFHKTNHLQITDPLFRKFMRIYLEQQEEHIGTSHYYMCTQLCNYPEPKKAKEIKPTVENAAALDHMIHFHDENAILVFPSYGVQEDFLLSIKDCEKLVLDMDGSMHKNTNYFWGINFVLGNSHNNSPAKSMYGDIAALAENHFLSLSQDCNNLIGTGLFPESFENNPMFFALAFDILTEDAKINLNSWIEAYTKRHYLTDDKSAIDGVIALKDTVYSKENSKQAFGSILCARPALQVLHTGLFDNLTPEYDNKLLLDTAKRLLSCDIDNNAINYDICTLTRQVIDNFAFDIYKKIVNAYRFRNGEDYERYTNIFLQIFDDIEPLLSSVPEYNAKSNLEILSKITYNDEEKNFFEINALTQLTVWGPMTDENQRFDCGWAPLSEFSGKYYHLRWRKFFEFLANSFGRLGVPDRARNQFYERDAYTYSQFNRDMSKFEKGVILSFSPSIEVSGNTKEIAKKLIEKYTEFMINN